jgi:hypothetical protein
VAKLSNVTAPKLKTVAARRAWLQSTDKRIVVHFTPFHGSWLNGVEIWFGILNQKCLKESFATSTALIAAIMAFVEVWNQLLAHPFDWTYQGTGLQQKAVQRFLHVVRDERQPLPLKLLIKQWLLMTHLLNSYAGHVDRVIWQQFSDLLQSKNNDLNALIAAGDNPRQRTAARKALTGLSTALANFLKTIPMKVA